MEGIFSSVEIKNTIFKNYLFSSNVDSTIYGCTFDINKNGVISNFTGYKMYIKDNKIAIDEIEDKEKVDSIFNTKDPEWICRSSNETIRYNSFCGEAVENFGVKVKDNGLYTFAAINYSKKIGDHANGTCDKEIVSNISYEDTIKDIDLDNTAMAIVLPFSANPPIIVLYDKNGFKFRLNFHFYYLFTKMDNQIYNSIVDSKVDVKTYTLVHDTIEHKGIKLTTASAYVDMVRSEYACDRYEEDNSDNEYKVISENSTSHIGTYTYTKYNKESGPRSSSINYLKSTRNNKIYPISIKYDTLGFDKDKTDFYNSNKEIKNSYNPGWELFDFDKPDAEDDKDLMIECDHNEVPDHIRKKFFAITSLESENEDDLWNTLAILKISYFDDVYVIRYHDMYYGINTVLYSDEYAIEYISKNIDGNYKQFDIKLYDNFNDAVFHNFVDRINTNHCVSYYENCHNMTYNIETMYEADKFITKYKDKILAVNIAVNNDTITKINSPLYNINSDHIFIRNDWGNLIKIDLKDYKMNIKE